MGEIRSLLSPIPHLDLNNFDSTEAEDSRYVLTSPRSLESCARLGVKPVELLIKSLNEFITERHDMPFGAVTVMHESYEKECRRRLKLCREERERIVKEAGDRGQGCKKLSTLETVLEVSSLSAKYKPKGLCSGDERKEPIRNENQGCNGKSSSSYTFSDKRQENGLRPDKSSASSSLSLGDLRYSPATEMQLERLTRDIQKGMNVTISETDRKIAALMLMKHQEEQARLKQSVQEEQERQEALRQEEVQRTETEKRRRKQLMQSMRHWHDELEARRRLMECQEKHLAGLREQEVLLQEDRWRRLTEELEAQRRERAEASRREAELRKRYQEKMLRDREQVEEMERDKERQVALGKEEKARKTKMTQERRERKRLQQENRRELLRHLLQKQRAEQQLKEEEALMRNTLDGRLHRCWEKHMQAVKARATELQERSARSGEQIQRAQLRAELQSQQQLRHRQLLVQLSQHRTEKASLSASVQHQNRAQRAHQSIQDRQLCHRRVRDRVQREEEAERAATESYLSMKEYRRERLQRQREQMQEEARRAARASFHVRERVRQHTQCRTFDQMALEAQITACMGRVKL